MCIAYARYTAGQKSFKNRAAHENEIPRASYVTRERSTYAEAMRGGRANSSPYQGVNNHSKTDNNHQRTSNYQESEFWFGSFIGELKSLLAGLDLHKLMSATRNLVANLKNCHDGMSKFVCIVESFVEFFD